MSATYRLFNRWKSAKGYTSDNQGATALGMARASVSQWKSGRNAEAHVIAIMAKDLGDEPGAWLAAVQAEKSTAQADRKEWERLAKALGYAAAVFLSVGISTARAETRAPAPICSQNQPTLYIM
jgi:transcriptional regulator with XRE-family HTH domain